MTTTKTTPTTTATPKANFKDLLRKWETTADNDTNDSDRTNALTDLATATAYAVLKKLYTVSAQRTIRDLQYSITRDRANLNRIEYANENATATEYTEDGDTETVIKDRDLYKASTDLCKTSECDGLDLVNTAVVAVLTETEKATDRSTGWMERKYTVRRLKRKVWIQTADSVGGWETAETSPIQEVYKAVRREIESNRAIQIASNKYTYLEDLATDSDSDTESAIYRRLPKYSGLAYEITDFNEKVTAITADTETVETVDRMIETIQPTKRQAEIIKLRLSGYGQKAIATALGVSVNTVKGAMTEIRRKATERGIQPKASTNA